MAPNLSPTAHAILTALTEGPATAAHLRATIGRSKSTTDKTLNDLVTHDLIIATRDGDDGDAQPQYSLPPNDTTSTDTHDNDADAALHAAADDSQQNPDGAEPVDAGEPGQAETITQEADPTTTSQPRDEHDPQEADSPDPASTTVAEAGTDAEPAPGDRLDAESDGEGAPASTEADAQDVKVCRGCQTLMPLICPCCGRKTLAYCINCQAIRPAPRRGEPGEPEILANGLPKLRAGELAQMVLKVMTDNPVPEYRGVIGWTSSRIAVFLAGRSTGAIGESLEKLTKTGQAQFLGDGPRRYILTPPHAGPDTGTGTGTEVGTGTDETSATEGVSSETPGAETTEA